MIGTDATILVVDDIPANARLLEAVLEPRGYGVRCVDSGAEALDVLTSESIDLVLLDVQMPAMNGYEVCRRIRENPATAMLPVVMVTAAGNEERVNALDAGADDFIVRPLNQAELLARVKSLLRIKAYHDALEGQAAELAAFNQHLEHSVQEQVEELSQLRRLRRFLPAHLAAVVESSTDSLLEPHRREIAVLFIDLRGFTSFSSSVEPEEVQATLSDFHGLLGELVAKHGATVGFFAGDGVMLFFNDPLPCEEPAQQAVALAAEMLDRYARRRPDRLGIGAGVSFGYATLGIFGFEGRWDYTAIGPVVNVASRLCQAAEDGEILLSERAVAALGGAIATESRGDVALRGVGDAVPVWAVLRGGRDVATPRPPSVAAAEAAPPVAGVEIAILGPLDVRCLGRDITLRSAKERALLAVLAACHGQVLSVDRLADDLWEGAPPDSAVASLRVYVSRLRKTLTTAGADGVLVTKATGYQLRVDPAAIDAVRFETLADEGATALRANEPDRAVHLLRASLSLWRGPALADAGGAPSLVGHAARLEERRLTATEELLDAEIALGNYGHVVSELEALIVAEPLRERFWAQRMLALYRSGRQPEALRAYQEVRAMLADELGLEPSAALIGLERAIATGAEITAGMAGAGSHAVQ